MKLASLKSDGRDGSLVLVNSASTMAVAATAIASNLQQALDNWLQVKPALAELAEQLEQGQARQAFALRVENLLSPLPRAYQWADGSAYLNHVELVRKARGAEMPPEFLHDPLMYQGGSDSFLAPQEPIALAEEAWGIDFESEVAVITTDVPMGVSADTAGKYVALVLLVNDVSLRNLIPAELAKGFGFLQSKPSSAFSPFACTPEALGKHWRGDKLHLPLLSYWNDKLVGRPNAGVDMQFSFAQLIAHLAKTRPLCAGTIIGSGTVSNRDAETGYSCIQEIRMREKIEFGESRTPFMRFGDSIRIEMRDEKDRSIFGEIDQKIIKYTRA